MKQTAHIALLCVGLLSNAALASTLANEPTKTTPLPHLHTLSSTQTLTPPAIRRATAPVVSVEKSQEHYMQSIQSLLLKYGITPDRKDQTTKVPHNQKLQRLYDVSIDTTQTQHLI